MGDADGKFLQLTLKSAFWHKIQFLLYAMYSTLVYVIISTRGVMQFRVDMSTSGGGSNHPQYP